MKKIMLLAVLAISTHLFAQDQETFLGEGKITSTGYGTLSTQYSRINGRDAVFTGAYGGWMINHKFMIGLGGYGMATSQDGFDVNGEIDKNQDLRMGYGGLMFEYTFLGHKKIHATANLLMGGGGVVNGHNVDYVYSPGNNFHSDDESGFKVLHPTVNVEANMTNWFRIGFGAGYRLVEGVHMSGLTDAKLSAPSANITLKFGIF